MVINLLITGHFLANVDRDRLLRANESASLDKNGHFFMATATAAVFIRLAIALVLRKTPSHWQIRYVEKW